jgi:hypothetical protein
MRISTGTDQVLQAKGVGAGAALVTGMVALLPVTQHSAWAATGGRIVVISDLQGSHVPPAIPQALDTQGQVPRAAAAHPTAAAAVNHLLQACPAPRLHPPGVPNQPQLQQQVAMQQQQGQVWQLTTLISLAARTITTSTTWLVPRCPTL